jgi:hypothetical protein
MHITLTVPSLRAGNISSALCTIIFAVFVVQDGATLCDTSLSVIMVIQCLANIPKYFHNSAKYTPKEI